MRRSHTLEHADEGLGEALQVARAIARMFDAYGRALLIKAGKQDRGFGVRLAEPKHSDAQAVIDQLRGRQCKQKLAAGIVGKPYLSRAADRPRITHGVQSGDVSVDSAVIWSRTDRPARMLAEIATTDSFRTIHHTVFVDTLPESDFTARALIEGLPAGQEVFYRIRFQDLSSPTIVSEAMTGRFRTAPSDRRSVAFAWKGSHLAWILTLSSYAQAKEVSIWQR